MIDALTFTPKRFDELTTDELYDVLRLRAEVFVVEQDCPYQDLDGIDRRALHLLGTAGRGLVAYARWFNEGDVVWLGRIVTSPASRGTGAGSRLMDEALRRIGGPEVRMHAQAHLRDFYGRWGFERAGEPFLEDGIPHVLMVRQSS